MLPASDKVETQGRVPALTRAAAAVAASTACGSVRARPTRESDEAGDEGFWIGAADGAHGRGGAREALRALQAAVSRLGACTATQRRPCLRRSRVRRTRRRRSGPPRASQARAARRRRVARHGRALRAPRASAHRVGGADGTGWVWSDERAVAEPSRSPGRPRRACAASRVRPAAGAAWAWPVASSGLRSRVARASVLAASCFRLIASPCTYTMAQGGERVMGTI